jgi:hypothetical protein
VAILEKFLPQKSGNEPGLPLPEEAEHLIDFWARNIEHGRFERALSGLTAASAVLATSEVYYEHYKGSFGNKFMWSPILVTPPIVVAGIAGVFSRRAAKTWLPITSVLYTGVALLGLFFHVRGVHRRPGGWHEPTYNVVMGPPTIAPGILAMVGGMGILAALLRRAK